MKTRLATTALLYLLCTAAANAQTAGVWRCGADGKSYSDTPCPGGLGLAVDDSRSPAQVLAAQDVAARERRLADQLVQDRERSERLAQARLAAPRTAPAHAAKPLKAEAASPAAAGRAKRRQVADDGIWRAVAPASRRTKG